MRFFQAAASLLASAAAQPSSDSNAELILISAGVVLAIAILGLIPVQIARRRSNRYGDAIIAVTVLWALLAAGSICYTVMRQMDYSATYLQRVESGYYDPQNTSDRPTMPVGLWCCLGTAYALIWLWAIAPSAAISRNQKPEL